jgi:hypothetical protein
MLGSIPSNFLSLICTSTAQLEYLSPIVPTSGATRCSISMASSETLPEIVLFGASMTEWSFEEKTQGVGWFLEKEYAGKAKILNEGIAAQFCPRTCYMHKTLTKYNRESRVHLLT